jgi:hypothetical protein
MSGAIPPLPQYASTAWCSVKAQGYHCHGTFDVVEELICRIISTVTTNKFLNP